MKLLLVTLALIVFPGSQAFVLRDESNPKHDQLLQELREYSHSFFAAFVKKWWMVLDSDIGTALSSWIEERASMVEQRLNALQAAFPPEVKNVSSRASSAYHSVVWKAENNLLLLDRKVAGAREAFYQALVTDLNPIAEKLDPYIQPLRHTLVELYSELNEKLNGILQQSLEQLQPIAKEVPIHLKEAQDSLEPIVDQVQRYVILAVEKAYGVLQQSAARVLEEFEKHREGFDQWVHAPLFPEDH